MDQRGKFIECSLCGGAGLRSVWSFGVKEPDECGDCGGSGRNWQYPGGAIASYYGGPFIGRAALAQEGGRDEELPPNYAACCNSTDLASCDCVNKQHIRALFAKGGRE